MHHLFVAHLSIYFMLFESHFSMHLIGSKSCDQKKMVSLNLAESTIYTCIPIMTYAMQLKGSDSDGKKMAFLRSFCNLISHAAAALRLVLS